MHGPVHFILRARSEQHYLCTPGMKLIKWGEVWEKSFSSSNISLGQFLKSLGQITVKFIIFTATI